MSGDESLKEQGINPNLNPYQVSRGGGTFWCGKCTVNTGEHVEHPLVAMKRGPHGSLYVDHKGSRYEIHPSGGKYVFLKDGSATETDPAVTLGLAKHLLSESLYHPETEFMNLHFNPNV